MKTLLTHIAVTFGLLSSTFAGDAFFSPDGLTVTLAPRVKVGCLEKVNVETGAVKFVPLTGELKDAEIESVAGGAEGEVMFLAKNALWILKEGEAVRRIASIAPAKDARDLFVDTRPDSKTLDWIFFSGTDGSDAQSYEPKLYARKPGEKKFKEIFCRRVSTVLAGGFSETGRLFFGGDHDVWEGGISPDDEVEGRLGTLVGARIAPLATLNTDDANGGGMGVAQIQPAGRWLYVHLKGHGMDAIVRMLIPAKPLYSPAQEELPNVKAHYAAMLSALGKVEIIDEDLSDISGFCACQVDSSPRIFFRGADEDEGKGKQLLLWEGTGKPRVIGHEPVEK